MKKVLLPLVLIALLGSSCKESKQLEGKIYITGNEPFVSLALMTNSGKSYFISKESNNYFELWNLQQKYICVFYDKQVEDTLFINNFKLVEED